MRRLTIIKVLLLALVLETTKYLLIIYVPLRNEFVAFLFVVFFYVAMVPVMLLGGEFGARSIAGKVALLCVGVGWNMLVIYLLTLAWQRFNKTKASSVQQCK